MKHIILVWTLLFVHFPVIAGENRWTSNGPYGGFIYYFAFHSQNPSIIYAGGYSIFRSEDKGLNWKRLQLTNYWALEASPQNPDVLIAADRNRIVQSLDEGSTWQQISQLPEFVREFEFDPKDSRFLYALTSGKGVFKSEDGGKTWKSKGKGLINSCCGTIKIDPIATNNIYVLQGGLGFKSSDAGESWFSMGQALEFGESLVIHPKHPEILYATGNGILKTVNGGQDWSSLSCTQCPMEAIALDLTHPDVLYVVGTTTLSREAIVRTTDGGKTWTTVLQRSLPVDSLLRSIAIHPTDGSIFAGGQNFPGIFRSTNGDTWNLINRRFNDLRVTKVTSTGRRGIQFFALGSGYAFESLDGQGNWKRIPGLMSRDVRAISSQIKNPNLIVAALFNGNVAISSDRGKNWKIQKGPPNFAQAITLALDPNNSNIIYIGSINSLTGIARSQDQGRSWESLPAFERKNIQEIQVDPNQGSNVFVTTYASGVLKSTNGGRAWQNLGFRGQNISSFSMNPFNTKSLLLSLTRRLFQSKDGGISWQEKIVPEFKKGTISFVRFSPHQKNSILMGVNLPEPKLFFSTNSGESWQEFIVEGLGQAELFDLAYHPIRSDMLYLATNRGVFSFTQAPR